MSTPLKPCPFCGAHERAYNELYVERIDDQVFVVCDCCLAQGPAIDCWRLSRSGNNRNVEAAKKAWNDRIGTPPEGAPLNVESTEKEKAELQAAIAKAGRAKSAWRRL